jgi:hypothetical protein
MTADRFVQSIVLSVGYTGKGDGRGEVKLSKAVFGNRERRAQH